MGEFMSIGKAIANNPLQLAIGVSLVIGVVYYILRKSAGEVADGVGGVWTGNNAATKDTAYEGKGVVGTVAGVLDKGAGGALSSIGESIGGWLYEATHDDYDPNKGKVTNADVRANANQQIFDLWGFTGDVTLRAN